jgi:hypothetical protein
MPRVTCRNCGTANPVHARFCGNCDTSLGVEIKPVPAALPRIREGASASGSIPVVNDNRAVPPRIDLDQSKAVLRPDVSVALQMRIRNSSTIVDAYSVMAESAPGWLTVGCPEVRLMPGESDYATVELGMLAGRFVEAQAITVRLRVYSLRDKAGFADVPVELTIPRYGRPVAIQTHPALLRLTDTTSVRVQVILDNAASNYARRLALTGFDSEGVVRCTFHPATALVPPGGKTAVDLDIAVPRVRDGEYRSRQLNISGVDDDGATSGAIITVNQERSTAPPVRISLEPSVLRIRDGETATVSVVVDNRGRTPNRTVHLKGEDPEGRVQFSFDDTTVEVARNGTASTTVYLSVDQVPKGAEVTRQFSVIAGHGADEVRASGTLVQSASDLPLKSAALRLTPETLHKRNSSKGRFRIAIENKDEFQWLNLALSGSDPEHLVHFDFSRTRYDIPPRGLAWGWIDVSAPRPERGKEVSREIEITARDRDESVSTRGTFIHSSADWVRYVRYVLTVLGAIVAIVGAFLPWTVAQNDYYPIDLALISSADIVAKTQPSARLVVIVLVVAMVIGIFGKSGKLTMLSSAVIAIGMFGYLIVLSTKVITDGPMHGAILVVVGAVVGLVGGLLARL